MEAHLLDCVGDVIADEGELLKSPDETVEIHRVDNWHAVSGRKLGANVNGSGAGLAINHASVVQDVEAALALTEEKAIGPPGDTNNKEMM